MSLHNGPRIWSRVQSAIHHVNRRQFIGAVGAGGLAAVFGRSATAAPRRVRTPANLVLEPKTAPVNGKHVVPPLPYAYNALEPHIDTMTMQLHRDRHHAAYVNNLNTALANFPALQNRNATELIARLETVPEAIRMTVRNNAGGHVNHSIFWAIMAPNAGGEPTGALGQAINTAFGSFANFKQQFNTAGLGRFGSGWVWLAMDGAGKLAIVTTQNQDNPYMMGMMPIIGNDVWEHAYYLKYQNRRADYLAAWWNVVNWHAAGQRYEGGRR